MRFASAVVDGTPVAVGIQDGHATPLVGIEELGLQTPISVLDDPPLDHEARVPTESLQLRPLIPSPSKVICVGLNYAAHAAETGRDVGDFPVLFTKFAQTLTGPYADIRCPEASEAIDYEGELAVVIGRPARDIDADEAWSCVAGVTVANDVSMRDFQFKTHQWLQGKAWDASTPLGPELVRLDDIEDVEELTLRTTVNGKTVQETSTGQMLFSIPVVIQAISQFTALLPGDVILTGTPEGVGFTRDPKLLLKPGDVVEVEVEGVGRIVNRFVA
jgi:acylpyruvate hydrolase